MASRNSNSSSAISCSRLVPTLLGESGAMIVPATGRIGKARAAVLFLGHSNARFSNSHQRSELSRKPHGCSRPAAAKLRLRTSRSDSCQLDAIVPFPHERSLFCSMIVVKRLSCRTMYFFMDMPVSSMYAPAEHMASGRHEKRLTIVVASLQHQHLARAWTGLGDPYLTEIGH